MRQSNSMNRKHSFFPARSTVLSSTYRLASDSEQPSVCRRANGFTLMELLIVMAIIAILMLIAIPTVGSLKKRANDLSARQSIHAIQQAEIQYSDTYPANGYACALPALGGDPSAGAPSIAGAQILQADITSGYKSGYIFSVVCKDKVTVNGVDRFNSY